MTGKGKGPASYFPSIEKTCGKPVVHWFELLDGVKDRKHMEQVALLKAGHGHATAIVARHRRLQTARAGTMRRTEPDTRART